MRETEQILVLDAGTTSTRAILFAIDGTPLHVAQRALTQHYTRPGWVEHDAQEIWQHTLACMTEVVKLAGGAGRIVSIGITNQRETIVAWDRNSAEPLARAIVWQDRRTEEFCLELREAGYEAEIQRRTGLLLDPYFSATKMRWLIDNVDSVRDCAQSGRLAFGTVESWLAYKLSGGAHLSDASNASRTLLLALDGARFDEGLCDLFGIPPATLPEVVDNYGALTLCDPQWLGRAIPVTGMAGDQQSAALGHGCLDRGDTKATYGTGAFVLTTMGQEIPASNNRLLGTVLCQKDGDRLYALEGSVFVAGSLMQWLRDSLGLIVTADESEALAASVPDSGGVVIIPALSGLGAPHWRADARGLVTGLTFATGKAHLVRAALEAMACQTSDLAQAFAADSASWGRLLIDGGMSANNWMAQDIADMLGMVVERPDNVETTALGAALLASVGAGVYPSLRSALEIMQGGHTLFRPQMSGQVREERLIRWSKALQLV
ncbi:MAG: glycerol kinase [Sphingomonadaceae bacterium]